MYRKVFVRGVMVEYDIDNIDGLYGLPMLRTEDDEYYQLAYYSKVD